MIFSSIGSHKSCPSNTYLGLGFPVYTRARDLMYNTDVVHRMFFSHQLYTECFSQQLSDGCVPQSCPSSPCPVSPPVCALSLRSRRARLPSRGSRASSPHLPSKVLRAPALPCPARGLLWEGTVAPEQWLCPGVLPSHPCPHTLLSLPGAALC